MTALTRRDTLRLTAAVMLAVLLGVSMAPAAEADHLNIIASRTITGSHPVPFTNGTIAYGAIASYDESSPPRHFVHPSRNVLNIRNDTTGRLTVRTRTRADSPACATIVAGDVGWGTLVPGQTTGRTIANSSYDDWPFHDACSSAATSGANLRTIVDFYRTDQASAAIYSFVVWYRYSAPYPYSTRLY